MTVIGIIGAAIIGTLFWALGRTDKKNHNEPMLFLCIGIISMIVSYGGGIWLLRSLADSLGPTNTQTSPSVALRYGALPFALVLPAIFYFLIKKYWRKMDALDADLDKENQELRDLRNRKKNKDLDNIDET